MHKQTNRDHATTKTDLTATLHVLHRQGEKQRRRRDASASGREQPHQTWVARQTWLHFSICACHPNVLPALSHYSIGHGGRCKYGCYRMFVSTFFCFVFFSFFSLFFFFLLWEAMFFSVLFYLKFFFFFKKKKFFVFVSFFLSMSPPLPLWKKRLQSSVFKHLRRHLSNLIDILRCVFMGKRRMCLNVETVFKEISVSNFRGPENRTPHRPSWKC